VIHRPWMRLWGWRPSSPPPKFINGVSVARAVTGHQFDRYLAVEMNRAMFDAAVELHEQLWGTPIVGPRRNKELLGLSAFVQ
jgi:hypothetical protein